jgi:conjugative transfer signal peptidase TraF
MSMKKFQWAFVGQAVGRRVRMAIRGLGAGGAALALLAIARANSDVFLVNWTPSEPLGVYVRADGAPFQRGGLAAFLAPPAAFPYADRNMGYLRRTPILKEVAALAGDQVCTIGDALVINGVARARVAQNDRQGRRLPHWIGCRRLVSDEAFVFSNRAATSFDSRYFGPINLARAASYRPLITTQGIGS